MQFFFPGAGIWQSIRTFTPPDRLVTAQGRLDTKRFSSRPLAAIDHLELKPIRGTQCVFDCFPLQRSPLYSSPQT